MRKELQDKILLATNGTKTGAILRCAMGRNIGGKLPQFVGRATVTSDGFVMCDFLDGDNDGHMGAFVGSKAELMLNIERLAQHLKLEGADCTELAHLVDAWMGIEIIDMRSKANKPRPRALPGALGPEGE